MVKFPSVIIVINITLNIILLLLLQSPHGARASTAISQMRPNIKKRWTALI
jgi:preprotein translocase subunit SecG